MRSIRPSEAYAPSTSRVSLDKARILQHVLTSPDTHDAIHRVVFFGDSLSDRVPSMLRKKLKRNVKWRNRPILRDMSLSGLGLPTLYYMSELVVEAKPDVVVMELNLFWFSDYWLSRDASELIGWLPAYRWPEAAALILDDVGLSFDQMIWYRLMVSAGFAPSWRHLQRNQVRVMKSYGWARSLMTRAYGRPWGPLVR